MEGGGREGGGGALRSNRLPVSLRSKQFGGGGGWGKAKGLGSVADSQLTVRGTNSYQKNLMIIKILIGMRVFKLLSRPDI